MMKFIVLLELAEITELTDLISIVAKHFVKEKIAVLETSHMNRNHCNTLTEKAIVWEHQLFCHRDTRNDNFCLREELFFIINYFKSDVCKVAKVFCKGFCLVFISHQTNCNIAMLIVCGQAKEDGTGNIAKSYHRIGVDTGLLEQTSRKSRNSTGTHGRDPIAIEDCLQLSSFSIIKIDFALKSRNMTFNTTDYLHTKESHTFFLWKQTGHGCNEIFTMRMYTKFGGQLHIILHAEAFLHPLNAISRRNVKVFNLRLLNDFYEM